MLRAARSSLARRCKHVLSLAKASSRARASSAGPLLSGLIGCMIAKRVVVAIAAGDACTRSGLSGCLIARCVVAGGSVAAGAAGTRAGGEARRPRRRRGRHDRLGRRWSRCRWWGRHRRRLLLRSEGQCRQRDHRQSSSRRDACPSDEWAPAPPTRPTLPGSICCDRPGGGVCGKGPT